MSVGFGWGSAVVGRAASLVPSGADGGVGE
jgi:hypothetical protein